ncbi:hypothetical protein N431DRAFT_451044 [Stipitochalara longipes BDJ]|nr:hypothetical protein N431DRAFT_451044 [Stipitochalara longipes BDJ]
MPPEVLVFVVRLLSSGCGCGRGRGRGLCSPRSSCRGESIRSVAQAPSAPKRISCEECIGYQVDPSVPGSAGTCFSSAADNALEMADGKRFAGGGEPRISRAFRVRKPGTLVQIWSRPAPLASSTVTSNFV